MRRHKQIERSRRFKTIRALSRVSAAAFAVSLVCTTAMAQPGMVEKTDIFKDATPVGPSVLRAERGAGAGANGAVATGAVGDIAVILWDEVLPPKTGGGPASSVSGSAVTDININGRGINTLN